MEKLSLGFALIFIAGCASTAHKTRESATLVCIDNQSEHAITVRIQDADSQDTFGQLHLSGFGTRRRWVQTEGADNPVMVSLAISGHHEKWVPPAFNRIDLSPAAVLSLTVGMDGLTPFAHSSVKAGCQQDLSPSDSVEPGTDSSVTPHSSPAFPPDSPKDDITGAKSGLPV